MDAAVIVPLRAATVPGDMAETAPSQRDRHLQHVEPGGSQCIAGRRACVAERTQ